VEQWSFSLALQDGAGVLSTQVALENAGGRCILLLGQYANTQTRLASVTLAAIAEGGKYARNADGTFLLNKTVTVEGASATNGVTYPPQVSLVTTLDTGVPGASGRGRIHLPGPRFTLASFRITENDALATAAAVKDFITAVETDLAAQVSVASSTGPVRAVTALRVGRVLDTMRSRREDVLEAYVGVAL
jgi:hypothetical protein